MLVVLKKCSDMMSSHIRVAEAGSMGRKRGGEVSASFLMPKVRESSWLEVVEYKMSGCEGVPRLISTTRAEVKAINEAREKSTVERGAIAATWGSGRVLDQ